MLGSLKLPLALLTVLMFVAPTVAVPQGEAWASSGGWISCSPDGTINYGAAADVGAYSYLPAGLPGPMLVDALVEAVAYGPGAPDGPYYEPFFGAALGEFYLTTPPGGQWSDGATPGIYYVDAVASAEIVVEAGGETYKADDSIDSEYSCRVGEEPDPPDCGPAPNVIRLPGLLDSPHALAWHYCERAWKEFCAENPEYPDCNGRSISDYFL